jgi:hypothetical protein
LIVAQNPPLSIPAGPSLSGRRAENLPMAVYLLSLNPFSDRDLVSIDSFYRQQPRNANLFQGIKVNEI